MLGLIGVVAADQQHAAGFGHPEHVVPQLRVGRPDVRRHDRVQVAAPHRRQVPAGEARVPGQMGDRWPRNRLSWWASRPQAGPGWRRLDRVGAHQGGTGDQGGEQSEREAADPEERRIAEQCVLRGQPADGVEVPLVVEQAAWVCTAPLGVPVEPDV